MGYYMRYFMPTSAQPLTLQTIKDALKTIDTRYHIAIDPAIPTYGTLSHDGRVLGEIEINQKDDEVFEEEIDDILALLAHHQNPQKADVITYLHATMQMVAVCAVWEDGNPHDADAVHEHIDPLWAWLDSGYDGMLHCDADGFYRADKLLLEMNIRL